MTLHVSVICGFGTGAGIKCLWHCLRAVFRLTPGGHRNVPCFLIFTPLLWLYLSSPAPALHMPDISPHYSTFGWTAKRLIFDVSGNSGIRWVRLRSVWLGHLGLRSKSFQFEQKCKWIPEALHLTLQTCKLGHFTVSNHEIATWHQHPLLHDVRNKGTGHLEKGMQ